MVKKIFQIYIVWMAKFKFSQMFKNGPTWASTHEVPFIFYLSVT
jgi:hypothetical protein